MSESQSTVQYRDIPGFPGYRVGDDGSVWSCWKQFYFKGRPVGKCVEVRMTDEWKKLRPAPNQDGHLRACLRIGGGQKRQYRFVHQLVLLAFVGPRPKGLQSRHFPDQNPANNNLSNLSYATPKVNQGDRVANGTHNRGAKCYAAKLTEDQVRQIRAEYAAGGITQRALAKKVGIQQGPLSNLLLRKSWKDVA